MFRTDQPGHYGNVIRKVLWGIAALLLLVPIFYAGKFSAAVVSGQLRSYTGKVIFKTTFPNEPIEVVEVRSDGQQIELDVPFEVDGDWLSDFQLRFKNVSDREIVYLSIMIEFPESDATGIRMGFPITMGSRWSEANSMSGQDSVGPGDYGEIRIRDGQHERLKQFLANRHNLSDLNKAHLNINALHFSDGAQWNAGKVFVRDPDHPGRLKPIDEGDRQ